MEVLAQIGQWSGYVLWALVLVFASLFVYLGLGGNFIILGLALVHALVTGFDPIGWTLLIWLTGIAVLGEIIEFLIGTFWITRKGATRAGVIGAFVGGLLLAAVGNSVVPVVGAVLGSFVGAFSGAVAGEYWHRERMEPSLRVGGQAFLGRLLAIVLKHLLGLVMVGLILRETLP